MVPLPRITSGPQRDPLEFNVPEHCKSPSRSFGPDIFGSIPFFTLLTPAFTNDPSKPPFRLSPAIRIDQARARVAARFFFRSARVPTDFFSNHEPWIYYHFPNLLYNRVLAVRFPLMFVITPFSMLINLKS